MARTESRLQPEKVRFARLLERLGRTSFRDRFEREILLAEFGRTMAELPSAGGQIQTTFVEEDDELVVDSLEAMAAVERSVRALEEPESSDAWVRRLERLESNLSLLLAAEEDLLEACDAHPLHVPPAAEAPIVANA
jgi:hypothetical protein